MQLITFANLWIEGAWRSDVAVEIDDLGRIARTLTGPSAAEQSAAEQSSARRSSAYVPGLTLPGLADAHCHAFQRMLPAWTQRARTSGEDFWSWREAMYTAAAKIGYEDLEAIAARCYLDLLRGGYTGVAEFLYLHRLRRGSSAALDADVAIARAAARVGIRLTLLPTLYQQGNFGRAAPTPGQAPFIRSTEQFMLDFAELRRRYPSDGDTALGVAFHSLRAVDAHTIADVSSQLAAAGGCAVTHIHVAEQPAEVAACLNHYGSTPVALLAERGLLGPQWALVHATHASATELEQIAASGATLVLCPTTEADLGDGCADAAHYLQAGGRLAIGSDSNIGCNAWGELRQLEWALRLLRGRRNVLASSGEPAVADRLYRAVLQGGWPALGHAGPAVGELGRADFVTFDSNEGDWPQLPPEYYLSALVFGSMAPVARQVMVGGRWLIRDGRHAQEAEIDARYRGALERLKLPLRIALNDAIAR
ncbi:MAG TPA: formimidoylglutamate deiminase [Steroidobacteraceae bacterium]|jgi:formimidoylglutamate deiminase|nr:formimidoylglutamate deiminase [Steroidobacteraceae bacterium]